MSEYTAGIFIINDYDEILLTHATHSPIKYWGIPKGLVDQEVGESNIDAAIREVEEETGIKFLNEKKIKYLGKMKYKTGKKTLIAFYVFLKDLEADDLLIIGKDTVFVPEAKIDSIDPLILYCKSMVYSINSEPFPEVDAFRWFPLDVAKEILYQPQKAILPDLLSIIIANR